MREIGSREYAEHIEDTITNNIENAVCSSFDYIAREYGFMPDYYERESEAFRICDALWANGAISAIRDAVIEQFERHGMDITGDGRDF